ncbi:MAG TPA: ABC transporter ATP-binding protein [Micropruina sp.]|nr:ABC transporter ATP-binding protein [Micropruina sp.]
MNALELTDVRHAFHGRLAVDGLSLVVAPGEVLAMIGLNGAGKTTALRVLAGRLRPQAGRACVLGERSSRLSAPVAARFGQLIDTALLYPELTVRENLVLAGRLHGLDRTAASRVTDEVIERFALGPWAAARTRALSSGNRQRLGVATAVAHAPAAVILDEPTNALDPAGVVVVREAVRHLAAQGAGVLVSSHHLDEVSRIADRIVAVHAGRMVGALEPGGVDLERRFFDLVLAADEQSAAHS